MLIYLWIVVLCLLSITGPVDTLSHRWISSQHLKRKSIYIPFALEQRRIISLHASSVHEDKIATTKKYLDVSNSDTPSYSNKSRTTIYAPKRANFKQLQALIVSARDIDVFTRNMKQIAYGFDGSEIADDLLPVLEDLFPIADAAILSDWFWCLGRVGFCLSNQDHYRFVMKLIHRLCEMESLSARQVTTSFGGLSRLRMQWKLLPQSVQNDIVTAIEAITHDLNEREIGNLLHSLSKLSVPWISLPATVQNGLLEAMVRNSKGLQSRQGSMVVYALGCLGADIDSFTPAIRDNVFVIAQNVLSERPEQEIARAFSVTQQVSNIVYGLAKLGARINEQLPPRLLEAILESINYAMRDMKEQEISNTVYSLGIMGANWASMPERTRHVILSTTAQRFSWFESQGVSNVIYGMALMQAKWDAYTVELSDVYKLGSNTRPNVLSSSVLTVSNEYKAAACAAIADKMNVNRMIDGMLTAQAAANIIYSLGISNVKWSELPVATRTALYDALCIMGPSFKSQEISNVIYGCGLLGMQFGSLRGDVEKSIVEHFGRVSGKMNQQELCSSLHGFAKMQANWETNMSSTLKKYILTSILNLLRSGSLCLACTIYSLGLMQVDWETLPQVFKDIFERAAHGHRLRDQEISNTLYGLCLMQASWVSIGEDLRTSLLRDLSHEQAFAEDVPQHIANSLWALSKMDAPWCIMPSDLLEASFRRCAHSFSTQEVSNALYGLTLLDASWNTLAEETKESVYMSLKRSIPVMAVQEISTIMYAMPIFTFDAALSVPADADTRKSKTRSSSKSTISQSVEKPRDPSEFLWRINEMLLHRYKTIDSEGIFPESYDCFAIYFEFMRSSPHTRQLVVDILGSVPETSGPTAAIPSRLHSNVVHEMENHLKSESEDFAVFHEFNGLRGVFAVDTAVYLHDELVALVEVDGETHYKQISQQLRRKDKLKEYLYMRNYQLPLYRMRVDQIMALGSHGAGKALAQWLVKDLTKKGKLIKS